MELPFTTFTVTRKGRNVAVIHSSAKGEVEKNVKPGSLLSTEDDSIGAIFARYHRTRNPLSSTDAACLENFTSKCGENIDHLQGRVAKLQQEVFQLCQRIAESLTIIDRQQEQIEFARLLRAPIRSLPAETLDMIFEFALFRPGGPLGCVVTDRTSPPMVVSQVCKLWRDVALRNSKLWYLPRIVIREESTKALSSQQHLFDLFVQRSQMQNLTLGIVNGPYSRIPMDSPGHRQLLAQVSKTFPRCSSFEIHLQSPGLYHLLTEFEDTTTTWANLNHLSICSDMFTRDNPPLKVFSRAPKLKSVKLNVGATSGLGNVGLPYHRLEVFWCQISLVKEPRPAQALWIWQQLVWRCINAQHLVLDLYGNDLIRFPIKAFPPKRNVVLKKVRSVSIANDYYGNADLLLSAFTFPSLHSLSFDFIKASHFLPKSKTTSQVGARSYFNLTEHFGSITALTLLRVSIEDDDLLELFKSAPRLTSLDLLNLTNNFAQPTGSRPVVRPNDNHFVHLLSTMTAISQEDEGSLLPYLSFLSLYYPYEEGNRAKRAEAYASMAKARARMNCEAVRSGSRRSALDASKLNFEFHLSFREGIKTADDISTVTKAMDSVNFDPPHFMFEPNTLPNFDKVLGEGHTDACSRVRRSFSN